MRVNRDITLGNIVSWGLILMAFITSYGKLQGTASAALETAKLAENKAQLAQDQIVSVRITLEGIRAKVVSIDEKVDDIRKNQR